MAFLQNHNLAIEEFRAFNATAITAFSTKILFRRVVDFNQASGVCILRVAGKTLVIIDPSTVDISKLYQNYIKTSAIVFGVFEHDSFQSNNNHRTYNNRLDNLESSFRMLNMILTYPWFQVTSIRLFGIQIQGSSLLLNSS